jgi:hypothetical protein
MRPRVQTPALPNKQTNKLINKGNQILSFPIEKPSIGF